MFLPVPDYVVMSCGIVTYELIFVFGSILQFTFALERLTAQLRN